MFGNREDKIGEITYNKAAVFMILMGIIFDLSMIYQEKMSVMDALGFMILTIIIAAVYYVFGKNKYYILFFYLSLYNYIFIEGWSCQKVCLENNVSTVFLNVLLLLLVFIILYALINQIFLCIVLGEGFVFLIVLANFYLIKFRGRGLYFSDLLSVGTAKQVAGNFSLIPDVALLWEIAMILVVAWVAVNNDLRVWDIKNGVRYRLLSAGICMLLCVLLYNNSTLNRLGYTVYWWDLNSESGFLLGFILQGENYGVKESKLYQVKHVEELNTQYEPEEQEYTTPDIIVVMNESFSDLNVINDLELIQDNMPFIHSLTENCIKGNLYVSVFGGNTANTEYEFLTGDTMSFYKYGQVAYNTYLNHATSSSLSHLKKLGYQLQAFHPWNSNGWNRVNVYTNLGFDGFTFLDTLPPDEIEYLRLYPSDRYDFKKTREIYDNMSENPRFIFNVTMQNHAGYDPHTSGDFDKQIQLTMENAQEYPLANTYMSLVYESDKALEEMIESYKESDRPVIICYFGDHQPGIETAFYEQLYGKPISDLTLEEQQKQYITPFVIWANFDIESKVVDKMSANYLFAYLQKVAGMELTPFQSYLLDLYEKYPVINSLGAIDADNHYYSGEELADIRDIQEYYTLIYNQMIDEKHTVAAFFEGD